MNVYASVALSGDGYMDDRSPRRLILSTPADWRDVMRLRAWADAILVGAETVRRDDPHAPRFEPPFDPARFPQQRRRLEGMEVTTYTLHPDRTEEDLHYLRQAIALSRRCTPCATSYRVGAVIVTRSGDRFTGYTHETSPTHHAEQEAILKATAAGADLHGASIYSSMEPCSTRSSEPESCSELILRHGFSRTVFALYEPSCFVCCEGAVRLRKGDVEVRVYPQLAGEVRAINGHLGLHE